MSLSSLESVPNGDRENHNIDLLRSEDDGAEFNLVADMTRFRENPVEYMRTLGKHVLGSSWRSYDEVVGHPLYYPGQSDELMEHTMRHPVIQERINRLADLRIQKEQSWILSGQQRIARRQEYAAWIEGIATQMVQSTMAQFDSKATLRFMYYVVGQIFLRTYHQGVHINEAEMRRLKAKAAELSTKRQSLVFLPCHKSHIDYMVLQFTCFRVGISLPIVVAGDNLNFAVVGPMLKQVGAMYIRRTNWAQDYLYPGVVQAFIETILKRGYNFECFIEGTRSRTGKLLPPKFGILKYILDAILNGAIEDTWIAPVSTQYDKVVEGETYATELLGHEKVKESLWSFLDSRKILSLKMGRVDLRFGEPWSLREWVVEQLQLASTEHFPLAQPIPKETHSYVLRSLGYRILADINKASVVMPTALVGATLMTWSGRGISLNQLNRRVSWLINKVQEAGGRLGAMSTIDVDQGMQRADGSNSTINVDAVVQNALKVLGNDLVGVEHKKLLEPVYHPKDPFRLSYYRNQIIYLFISEAIVSAALFTLLKQTGSRRFKHSSVEEVSRFLSTLLSGEFVYGPQGLQANLAKTLDNLAQHGVVVLDGDEVELSLAEISTGSEVFDFYCYLIWPFIDGYWAASVALYTLADGKPVPEKPFHSQAQSLAKTLYAEGELTHYEALNKEMLKFAFQHYETRGVLKRVSDPAKGPCVVLADKWIPPRDASGQIVLSGPLFDFSEEIAKSRNRPLRHGIKQVLNSRILGLTAAVSASFKL